ncbi:MAG: DUF3102 domain-containing protein [Acidobacteriota bacterium]|nr:DUF3102 domain-containing protein [Acidobacteriota bacterium]
MGTALAQAAEQRIARPLTVLVPLIKDDLARGKDAAERAGMPYYQAAGEKMLEAKTQLKHGEFVPWVTRNFGVKYRQASNYMKLAEALGGEKCSALHFSTLSAFTQPNRDSSHRPGPPSCDGPVEQVIDRLDTETRNLRHEDAKRQENTQAERALTLHLIDIGYKVLARELHPDKGGSRDEMTQLNVVRADLRSMVLAHFNQIERAYR